LTRVARSHIRVGTFEYLRARGDEPSLLALADYAIDRHFPELTATPRRYSEFLRAVADRQRGIRTIQNERSVRQHRKASQVTRLNNE
jgi:serine/tyrosine/threonine adenylyltransferase